MVIYMDIIIKKIKKILFEPLTSSTARRYDREKQQETAGAWKKEKRRKMLMKKWIAAWLAVLVPLSATPAVWADTLPGGENESALVMVEKNGDVAITQDNFPDDTFRQMVKDEFDTNGDNVLSQGERDAVTALDVQEGPVASLKGVEVFPHLQVLNPSCAG